MQNELQTPQRLSPYFTKQNLLQYMQGDEIPLWEAHRANAATTFKVFALIAALSFLPWLIFLNDSIKLLFLIIWLSFVLSGFWLVYRACYKNPTHYVLTQQRFFILYFSQDTSRNPRNRKLLGVDLTQVLGIERKNSIIKIHSPTLELTKIKPAKDIGWLYEELVKRWEEAQAKMSTEEKARLEHLYNPPMKSYIKFQVAFLAFLLSWFFLYSIANLLKISFISNNHFFTAIFTTLMSISGLILRPLFIARFLGKEYVAVKNYAPKYQEVIAYPIAIFLLIIVIITFFTIP